MIGQMVTLGTEIAGITCRGGRAVNEDSYAILPLPDGYLLAVADGIGGQPAGDRASSLAISTLRDYFSDNYIGGMHRDKSHDLLRDGFAEAHRRVREAATGDASGMGTTLVAAFVRRNTAIIAHTGDSRAYHLSGRIVSVTTDHSLVCDMVERGLLDPCELFHHPLRSYITRSIGGDFLVESRVSTLHPGDVLLLATDGFYEHLDEEALVSESLHQTPAEILSLLMQHVLLMTRDNATAVIYRQPV
ncbi:MAG: serine/threonine-protein phosphatase [Methanocalculus sp. MSAO_Arc1]|uniref:PP2C family protein-serine/threonine phosphatase n=1 Tax=Methanocalculus TaxID=71151 RepID=UPI000FEF9C60|nr:MULTISPECIES: protein phosphatase 2C domain-containing protein [unclassified Methanocalculus]MCP1661895.1 serine/threonine protein phosphatase PrpC [Methanocalculus sp. AMF5]RQD81218.1 MAG: serine/threonine-protein phosphatase [Methanocalculus sp. MSAO_Arc1]